MSVSKQEEIISALWFIVALLCVIAKFDTIAVLVCIKATMDTGYSLSAAYREIKGKKGKVNAAV